MSRFELSLSSNYVSHWTVVEAIRELFQNALDQETENADNKMFFDYSSSDEVLRIGNKSSILDVKSLLLGESTKRASTSTIGQFGEGYKLALLVLSHLNKGITIYNYGAKEVWYPKLIKSRKYGGQQILVVDVDKKFFWQTVPDDNLVFEIKDITRDEYIEICDSNLHLRPAMETIDTTYGDIIIDDAYRGQVFVKGLYVNTVEKLAYGYNFKPQHMKLDRDRKMVTDFDLKWKTSLMWKECGNEHAIELAKTGAMDVTYLQEAWTNRSEQFEAMASTAYQSFRSEHGPKAYPVSTQDEADKIVRRFGKGKVEPVIVTVSYQAVVKASPEFKKEDEEYVAEEILEQSPYERLSDFYDKAYDNLSEEQREEFDAILEESKSWEGN